MSFEKTNNSEIAACIKAVLNALLDYNLTPDKIRNSKSKEVKEYDIVKGSWIAHEELAESLSEIDDRLSLHMSEMDYWDKMVEFVAHEQRRKQSSH